VDIFRDGAGTPPWPHPSFTTMCSESRASRILPQNISGPFAVLIPASIAGRQAVSWFTGAKRELAVKDVFGLPGKV